MRQITRRDALALTGAAALAGLGGAARAQSGEGGTKLFSTLREPGLVDLPMDAPRQRVTDSPAPAAKDPGRWASLPPLPLPRSEMAWATAWEGRLHVVGGYGEQRVATAYHHVYVAAEKRWVTAAPIPRPGNHIGIVATDGLIYAIGGHQDQNRDPYADCFVYEIPADRWRPIAPLPAARGAISVVATGGLIHAIGGAVGKENATKKSVPWHDAYDPKADRWDKRRPLPLGRDHMGAVVVDGRIHVIGGRIDSARSNVDDHDVYAPRSDKWAKRAALPTKRSGHGAVLYRGRIFVMGGEEFVITPGPDGRVQLAGKVFGQNEAYDPAADSWAHHAPMPTPRHGLGAAVVRGAIHVVGGGPMVGGQFQSAVHEAFTLG